MKTFRIIVGWMAILAGFVALITPLTPGATWLIFFGFSTLGFHFVFIDKIYNFFAKQNNKNLRIALISFTVLLFLVVLVISFVRG